MTTLTKVIHFDTLIVCTLGKIPVYFIYELGIWQQKKPYNLQLVDVNTSDLPTVHWADNFLNSDAKSIKLKKLKRGIYETC